MLELLQDVPGQVAIQHVEPRIAKRLQVIVGARGAALQLPRAAVVWRTAIHLEGLHHGSSHRVVNGSSLHLASATYDAMTAP